MSRAGGTSRKGKWCVRERIVPRTFSGSVVAKTNTTCSGGSSTTLSRALNASEVIWCASSMMTTL